MALAEEKSMLTDPKAWAACGVIACFSIYFIFKTREAFEKVEDAVKEVKQDRIARICERNCMKISWRNSSDSQQQNEQVIGSGLLIRPKQLFLKKTALDITESPDLQSEQDKLDQDFRKKDLAFLLTNYHVIDELKKTTASTLSKEKTFDDCVENHLVVEPMTQGLLSRESFKMSGANPELIYYDWKCDLALIRIDFNDCASVFSGRKSLALSEKPSKINDTVTITGFPLGQGTKELQARIKTAVFPAKINEPRGEIQIGNFQNAEDCFNCIKINASVEQGASGGPVMNSNQEIAGVIVSKVADGCLAISVSQIHKFLEDAEKAYENQKQFGKHGIKVRQMSCEVDGPADQYFEIYMANPKIKDHQKYFGNELVWKRITKIKVIQDGVKKNYTPSTEGAGMLVEQINRGAGSFEIKEIWYETDGLDESIYSTPYFSIDFE